MRSERWWQEASVIDGLFHTPTAYEFIQTTRLLRHDPIFNQVQHWADRFSFESSIQLNFPISEIESLNLAEDKIELKNLMVGLLGIQGALPYSYTQKIKLSPRKQRDEVQKFIGLFNHKLTAQYVDSSLVYNLPVRYEIDQKNHYLTILHALNGFVRQQHQPSNLDDFFAEFSGLMQGQNNNVHALKTMLHCVFKQKIEIKEFIVETFQLNDVQKTSLGSLAKNALGLNTFCGEKVRQVDGKIEVQIGPLTYPHYLDYLPGKGLSEQLRKIFKSWCDPTLHVDVRLILKNTEKKAVQIGANQSLGLGQGTFLMPKLTEDHNEFCYALIREI